MIYEAGDSYTPNHLTDTTANGCWWYVYELYAYEFRMYVADKMSPTRAVSTGRRGLPD